MNRLHQTLLTFAALSGFALASYATVIVDDTWADATRTTWNLPVESPWYAWTNSSSGPTMGVATNALYYTNSLGSTRLLWTYFTTNAPELTIPYGDGTTTNPASNNTNSFFGYPLSLAIGQAVQATLVFTLADVIPSTSNSKIVRFGLLAADTNNIVGTPANGRVLRDTSNITKSGVGVTGYRIDMPIYQTMANNALLGFRYRITNSTAVDPIGDNAAWSSTVGAGPTLTNWTGFLPNTPYTLTLAVQRYASSNVLAATLSGGSFTNLDDSTFTNFFSYSTIDISGANYNRFDNFLIRFDTAGVCTTLFTVKEFKVETLPVNFPITVVDKFNSDSCRLKWDTIRGQNYTIQCKTNLTDLSWTPIETVTATTTTLTWTNTTLTGIGQRFYRVANTP
jgi:hypothetical protein